MKVGAKHLIIAAAACLLAVGQVQAATYNYTDTDILNFALNLECLEAEFYAWAAYSQSLYQIDPTLVGTNSALGATTSGAVGGSQPGLQSASIPFDVIAEIAENEISHVRFLRAALGSDAVPCPALSLQDSTFLAAANAALTNLGYTPGQNNAFHPYDSLNDFYLAAFIFEDVGVTAYKGAVQNLQNPAYAAAAAGIMAIEAGHAAVVRQYLYAQIPTSANLGSFTYTSTATGNTVNNVNYRTAAAAIAALRDSLGGTSSSSVEQPLTRTPVTHAPAYTATSGPDLFPADTNGVAFGRTPTQVLDIVYFSNTTQPGGFLPQGATGNTNVVQINGTSTASDRCNTTSSKSASSGALSMAAVPVASAAAVLATAVAFML